MATKWVDNTEYFGPDRRKRPGPKRWRERRGADEAGEPPPIGALLRRLRVRLLNPTGDDRKHALEMLRAAIYEANRLGWRQCVVSLQAADQILRSNGAASALESKIAEAMDHANANR